ncbi:MAG: agglutinin biogenesis protein MshI [Caldimonas sp.]
MFHALTRPGWMAVALGARHVQAAHVVRPPGKRPLLTMRQRFDRGGEDDAADLARLRRNLGLQRFRCTTAVEPAAYRIVQVNAPAVAAAERNAALRWSVKDAIDFPAEDAIVESFAIPQGGAPAGRAPLVLAVAARRDRVAARVRAFQRAHVPLAAIDIAEAAQRNVAALFEQPGRGLAFLGFGAGGGLLTITMNGELHAVRAVDVKGPALADGGDGDARHALHDRIALEVQRSLDNFDRLFSQIALDRLLVAPYPGADALVASLCDNLALPVAIADLDEVLDCDADARFANGAEQAEWLHAVGLALRDERPAAAA